MPHKQNSLLAFHRSGNQVKVAVTGAISIMLCLAADQAIADPAETAGAQSEQTWAVHGQLTNVTQKHAPFSSPYSGQNSLDARGRTEETTDLTLYIGTRLGRGTELWINPEIDQGFGLSNTVGVAGFPSGEAYKIGANTPYVRLPRLFVRHVISLGGESAPVSPSANQLGGAGAANNVIVTAGKFSVVDIFDTNTYAHDPRGDFLNWSVIDAGAFDYAADAWGFTYGVSAEWNTAYWTIRGGVFQMSEVPNGKIIKVGFAQTMTVGELEHRHMFQGHQGKLKLLVFANHARMARYNDAVEKRAVTSTVPDVSTERRRATRAGVAINAEQELVSGVGVFMRASANDGTKEAYEFTEINKSISAGVALDGRLWSRAGDTFGVAGVTNGMSSEARRYFGAGGIGILIGDGKLDYRAEKIIETYYQVQIAAGITFALNYQHISNPAYNHERGPVAIYGARLHAQF